MKVAGGMNDMMGSAMKLMRFAVWLFACAFLPGAATADTITYYHNDLLGSPIVATIQTGAVVSRETFRALRRADVTTLKPNKVWYTSRFQDDDTRLAYMGARHYDPLTARFLSTDPAGFDGKNLYGFNRYSYATTIPTSSRILTEKASVFVTEDGSNSIAATAAGFKNEKTSAYFEGAREAIAQGFDAYFTGVSILSFALAPEGGGAAKGGVALYRAVRCR